jgi:uncharacterized small protein (DUF1192 family)
MKSFVVVGIAGVMLPFIAKATSLSQRSAYGDSLDLEVLDADAEARPVMKVVLLLKDVKQELIVERDTDKYVHDKQQCWCHKNEQMKMKATAEGKANIAKLDASSTEATAQIAELLAKREDTQKELDGDIKALKDATSLRDKDSKAFAKDEIDTIVATKSCKDAITVLQKHHKDVNTGFVEVRKAAENLQKARVLEIGHLENLKLAALKDFIQNAPTDTAFLSVPGYKSYGSRSGEIFGILNQMLDDFESHLSEIQDNEKQAIKDFAELKKAKQEEITGGEKMVLDLDLRLGVIEEKCAQAMKDLKDTKSQVADDGAFVADLKKKCADEREEYATRVRDRMAEMTAVDETIELLNDDDAFNLFHKTFPSFLQTSSTEAETKRVARQTVSLKLERVAAQTGSPWLALIASQVNIDSFTAVKKAINKMVAELAMQQKDEQDHKAWCIKEMNDNTKDTVATESKKYYLQSKHEQQAKNIDVLNKDIAATKDLIAETQVQMKKASETREAANADYQEAINDQRLTQVVLTKALNRMKEVYAFIETLIDDEAVMFAKRSHKRKSLLSLSSDKKLTPGSTPAFKKYQKNAGGSKVVSMIESIIADAKKSEADAIIAEQNAQTTYESFMTLSNKAITKASAEIATRTGNRARAEEDLQMTKKDMTTSSKKLADLADELGDLKTNCDFILKNFQTRQDARAAETDALIEAMSILSVGSDS